MKLTNEDINNLLVEYPGLPNDYLEYLKNHGWGESLSGRMVYEGPVSPEDIYDDNYEGPKSVVLFGDDFQGYCLGFDLQKKSYGEVNSFGEWESSSSHEEMKEYTGI